jgi:transcriptional regulator with XRE-family HTH domain
MGNLATNVKERRKSYGYTTVDLARLLDVSAGLINNIENSKNDVFKLQLLNNLLNLLNISHDKIFELKQSSPHLCINNNNLTISLDIRDISESDKHELVTALMPVLNTYVEIAASHKGNKKIIKQVNNCVLQQLNLFKLINCS